MRRLLGLLTVVAMSAGALTPVVAAPCKDARGKFTKCPPVVAAGTRCKTAAGKFAKCDTPGAIPMKK